MRDPRGLASLRPSAQKSAWVPAMWIRLCASSMSRTSMPASRSAALELGRELQVKPVLLDQRPPERPFQAERLLEQVPGVEPDGGEVLGSAREVEQCAEGQHGVPIGVRAGKLLGGSPQLRLLLFGCAHERGEARDRVGAGVREARRARGPALRREGSVPDPSVVQPFREVVPAPAEQAGHDSLDPLRPITSLAGDAHDVLQLPGDLQPVVALLRLERRLGSSTAEVLEQRSPASVSPSSVTGAS